MKEMRIKIALYSINKRVCIGSHYSVPLLSLPFSPPSPQLRDKVRKIRPITGCCNSLHSGKQQLHEVKNHNKNPPDFSFEKGIE